MSDSFKSTIASLRTAPPAHPIYVNKDVKTSVETPISPPSSDNDNASLASVDDLEVSRLSKGPVEDYEGNFVFAPIKEHQVRLFSTGPCFGLR